MTAHYNDGGMKPGRIHEIIEHFRRGGFVALLDAPDREGEADLLQAAEFVSGESLNFMAHHARGLVTVAITAQRLQELEIPLIEPRFASDNTPGFAVPVDYKPATTTGVSTFDRAATIGALIDSQTAPEDFARPGHVFPLAAAEHGLAQRAGHTEGAVALARLAHLYPAVVMCEIMAPDGHMAAGESLSGFVDAHQIPLVTVQQVQRTAQAAE